MRRKFRLVQIIIFLISGFVAVWYLFIKSWDYQIFFTVKTQPGVVYQGIHDWYEWNGKTIQKGKIRVSEQEPWKHIQTVLELNDTTLTFNWDLKQKNDSVTRVKVGVSDKKRKIYNRIRVPFVNTLFEKSITKNTLLLKNNIEKTAGSFRFKFIGIDTIKEVSCVYVSTKSTVRGKAYEMMDYVILLNQFVKGNKLGLNGEPMILINKWDPAIDSIQFDFCFPILHPELMPEDPLIKLKTVSMPKALKGDFYGNYSISDMSWHRLFEEAKTANTKTTGQILEVFYNDPHSGGNDMEWKAGIFMGIED